ncbi:MAG: hypothetical protein KDI30_11785 [Pseudomonadales bacterium]|nr:hypothetical protein [Pseudomonadales bacterium]
MKKMLWKTVCLYCAVVCTALSDEVLLDRGYVTGLAFNANNSNELMVEFAGLGSICDHEVVTFDESDVESTDTFSQNNFDKVFVLLSVASITGKSVSMLGTNADHCFDITYIQLHAGF